jgi:hypothetical protein
LDTLELIEERKVLSEVAGYGDEAVRGEDV